MFLPQFTTTFFFLVATNKPRASHLALFLKSWRVRPVKRLHREIGMDSYHTQLDPPRARFVLMVDKALASLYEQTRVAWYAGRGCNCCCSAEGKHAKNSVYCIRQFFREEILQSVSLFACDDDMYTSYMYNYKGSHIHPHITIIEGKVPMKVDTGETNAGDNITLRSAYTKTPKSSPLAQSTTVAPPPLLQQLKTKLPKSLLNVSKKIIIAHIYSADD